jgi:hypothetical protein
VVVVAGVEAAVVAGVEPLAVVVPEAALAVEATRLARAGSCPVISASVIASHAATNSASPPAIRR